MHKNSSASRGRFVWNGIHMMIKRVLLKTSERTPTHTSLPGDQIDIPNLAFNKTECQENRMEMKSTEKISITFHTKSLSSVCHSSRMLKGKHKSNECGMCDAPRNKRSTKDFKKTTTTTESHSRDYKTNTSAPRCFLWNRSKHELTQHPLTIFHNEPNETNTVKCS